MASELATNPLLEWTEFPAFDQIKIEHIDPAVRATLEKAEIALTALEVEPPTSWKGLMEPLEHLDDEVSRIWGVVGHLHAVTRAAAGPEHLPRKHRGTAGRGLAVVWHGRSLSPETGFAGARCPFHPDH